MCHFCVWHSGSVIQCHPEWIGIGVHKYLTECYFLCIHTFYSCFASVSFHCKPWFFSGKWWQLTYMQCTGRLTHVQHVKFNSCTSYYRATHEVWLVCSAQNMASVQHMKSELMCTLKFDWVTQQKLKNTSVFAQASINLDVSCTVSMHDVLANGLATWTYLLYVSSFTHLECKQHYFDKCFSKYFKGKMAIDYFVKIFPHSYVSILKHIAS